MADIHANDPLEFPRKISHSISYLFPKEETVTYEMADGYAGMERLLKRRDDFTAVFVISDAMAVAASLWIRRAD